MTDLEKAYDQLHKVYVDLKKAIYENPELMKYQFHEAELNLDSVLRELRSRVTVEEPKFWRNYFGAQLEMPDGSRMTLAVNEDGTFRLRGSIDSIPIQPIEERLGSSDEIMPCYEIKPDL